MQRIHKPCFNTDNGSCKNHTTLTIPEYQSTLEEEIVKNLKICKESTQNLLKEAEDLNNSSNEFMENSKKIEEKAKIAQNFTNEMEKVMSINEKNEKLEEMLKILPKIKENSEIFSNSNPILDQELKKLSNSEKIQRIKELENKNHIFIEEIDSMKQKISELIQKSENQNQEIKNLQKKIISLQEKQSEDENDEDEELDCDFFGDSDIINNSQHRMLDEFIEEALNTKPEKLPHDHWSLVYKGKILIFLSLFFPPHSSLKICKLASEDGFHAKAFHSKCDNLGHPSIVVVRSENGSIFGGFTTRNWFSGRKDQFVSDKWAFIFSLHNQEEPEREAEMYMCTDQQTAICCEHFSMPQFGDGPDLGFLSIFFLS